LGVDARLFGAELLHRQKKNLQKVYIFNRFAGLYPWGPHPMRFVAFMVRFIGTGKSLIHCPESQNCEILLTRPIFLRAGSRRDRSAHAGRKIQPVRHAEAYLFTAPRYCAGWENRRH